MARRKSSKIEVLLSEEEFDFLSQAGGDDRWAKIGAFINDKIEEASRRGRVDKAKFYERCAGAVGYSRSTVSQYATLEADTRDCRNMADFSPFTYQHWFNVRRWAKLKDITLWESATYWAESADEYGGYRVPIDVMTAALKAKGAEKSQDIGVFLERAYRALDQARALADGDEHDALDGVLTVVARLQEAHEGDGAAVDDDNE